MLKNGVLLISVLLMLCACGGGRQEAASGPAGVNDLLLLRHFDLPTGDAEPQPAWSPNGRWLMVRSDRSLLMMREGGRRRHRIHQGRRAGRPVWLDNDLVAFGPTQWVSFTEDGRLVVPTEGIRLLDVAGDGDIEGRKDIAAGAWRPRRWGDRIVGQRASSIFVYDRNGHGELFDEGYFPAPHPQGRGITLQTTPMIAPDHWTGQQELGNLVVRWPAGPVDLYRGCVQAAWCHDGGLVATRLFELPDDPVAWEQTSSEVVWIAGPGAELQTVMADARHPSVHPTEPIVAVTGPNQHIFICNRDGSYQREMIEGRRAHWSPDGRHLAVERVDPGTGLVDIRVLVFKLR